MELYLDGWGDFNVAMMGATAALAGLLIVAASVNIGEIIKSPSIAARLAAGLAGLVLAIVAAAVGLVPRIPPFAYGTTIVVAALAATAFSTQAARRIFQNDDPENRLKPIKALVGFVAPVLYVVGGALVLAGDSGGVTWFAVGSIAAIVAAILISWIALVEILR
ncbi:hypothetical protein ABC304_09045 [Microbacterium sp. 1P10UB]|uniref:hypothetical protein n=1 Tax=unclassified Microbacterium TaxID=2609290 RepID=UPI0039A3DAAB